ncbi:hypothetical protein [Kocuria sp. WN036]|uniref:hypothetical protein n=1 Tax=Kocuria sp. WN036 TaxID=2032628 RepID=UPI001140F03E|nr:hypothetical protein [Kocuria sp. WN036]
MPDLHVLAVERGRRLCTLAVETVPSIAGRPSYGALGTSHDRRKVLLHDLPSAAASVQVMWHKAIHRRREEACEALTFSEVHDLAAQRAKLNIRAIAWAVALLRSYDIAVSALAEMLGVA